MADKKITDLDVSQTISQSDKVFANVGGSAKQVSLSTLLAQATGSGNTFIIDIAGCSLKPSYSEVWGNITKGMIPILYDGTRYSVGLYFEYLNPGVRVHHIGKSVCGTAELTYTEFK